MLQNDDEDGTIEMYFKRPDQIEEIFKTLEGDNIFLI